MAARWTALLLMVLMALTPGRAIAQSTPVIQTIAGGGPNNVSADLLYITPYSVVADGTGNIYIADILGNRVYRRDPSGVMTVFAGTGQFTTIIDGGLATDASIAYPEGLALDTDGNLYIAGAAISRVDAATGVITIAAGGGTSTADGIPATQALIPGASGIALDTQGNLYISLNQRFTGVGINNKVRRVDAATGIITTVAGTGVRGYGGDGGPATAALLDTPCGIAVDAAGNLFISDAGNHRIRKVTPAGIITTYAGNGAPVWVGEGGPATSAGLIYPAGLALDSAGNLFIGDYDDHNADGSWNSRVWRVDAITGIFTRYAGGATTCCDPGDGGPATSAVIWYPEGLHVDPAGNLIIADTRSQDFVVGTVGAARKVDAATGIITTLAGGNGTWGEGGQARDALFTGASGLARDAAGNLFITERSRFRVLRVDAATGIITRYAGAGASGFDGDHGPAASAYLSSPNGLAVGVGGNLFIADSSNHRIRVVDAATGEIDTYAGDGTGGFGGDGQKAAQASLWYPSGIALEPSGDLLIADSDNHRIRRVSAANLRISTVAGDGAPSFGGDGGPATSASLQKPAAVAVDSQGNILIADTRNHRIRRVDAATGTISTVAGNGTAGFAGDGGPATAASLNFPTGVSVEADGSFVIVDSSNARIRRVDVATGMISTVAGTGTHGFSGDSGPAAGARINLTSSQFHGGIVSTGAQSFLLSSMDRIRRVEAVATAPAGQIPDGENLPGDSLTITHAPYGMMNLTWGDSCAASATDYALYQGELGSFTSYAPRFCTTGGATEITFAPDAQSRFYLVVPRNTTREGSYGRASDGSEHPPSAFACLAQEIGTCQ